MRRSIVTTTELKRRGAAALEDGLKRGPIRILKRNKTAAVVLSEAEYERLLAAKRTRVPGVTAMQWLLRHSGTGSAPKDALDERLRDERDW